MKRVMLSLIAGLFVGSVHATQLEVSGGVGAVVPDNESVESAPVGKVDGQFNIGDYLSIGLSASQTGTFNQEQKPQEVQFANANPQAFAGKSYYEHDGDIFIIDNSDVTTTINVLPAVDPLLKRPVDRTERSFWAAEPYIQVNCPLGIVRPYFRAFLGASGVREYSGDTNIGVSKGIGGGVSALVGGIVVSVEAMRRHIDTGVASYGNWQYVAKAGVKF